MGKSLRALGLLGLALVGLWYGAGGARSLPAAGASEVVAAPLTHENLCVYFVYGPDSVSGTKVMTLQEALERDLAVVHETSTVNTLAVENRSPDCELFIQSGDIVKGGKQDRMAATDMLIPPGSGRVALPAHCVEQGRWTNRGTEDAKRFAKADGFVVGKDMKYANASGHQSAVWQTVSDNQGKLKTNLNTPVTANASPTSFQLTLESPEVKAKVTEYAAALRNAGETRERVVGVVFVVNGQITGAEVYGSNAIFRKAWPKLLNAATVEAIAERTDKTAVAPPTPRAIEHFLARGADSEPAGTTRDVAEIFQTEGRWSEAFQTEGRVPETRTGQIVFGGSVNSDVGITGNVQPQGQQPANGVTRAVPTRGPIFDPSGTPNQPGAVANRVLAQDNVAPPAPPANPEGNRLNSNRTENRSTLMVESRDPARQNAVIHRSYIKK